ncbi:sigma 54-interacting transcriptional regulator [Brevibacillus laterosporus]|uniref:sigma 54-interacting transcriptional regulator n=1 Tax=Brevibacillus laterosporus TaxID=1465 RepID=UPI0003657355|nr:sigma-54-dependent transcriptional regulator [Brevibacillus laterosporus]ATO47857.1 transcriptional regulator [Brevibacillus laterosporus DSM 25]MED2005750.1 sigma 54-interacting transcriptional regulator [Brevibacillus laterosporus]
MKRIELIMQQIVSNSREGQASSAQELAELLSLSRANVSSDLNQLWREGRIEKSTTRPVRFSLPGTQPTALMNEKKVEAKAFEQRKAEGKRTWERNSAGSFSTEPKRNNHQGVNQLQDSVMDQLAKDCQSLTALIEQAKAALLYPPHGMHTLLFGETGVGKTMFAGLMYEYAVEKGILAATAPFITFNCADYAHNAQLLVGQLFGVKKGAYTGADQDRPGLMEAADNGILFLDEVHRLPSEGQEMLFTFIDKGFFRRVGETDGVRQATVRLIAATTENPTSALLATFTRRIPMMISLPSLKERGLEERLQLIKQFFQEESYRLGKDIHVSGNSIRALLLYHCPNNIGQLKTDIRLSCAKAYADFISLRKTEMQITTADLPPHVKEGVLHVEQNRQNIEKLIGEKKYFLFHPDQEPYILEDSSVIDNNIYERMEQKIVQLRATGVSDTELYTVLTSEIEKYFTNYLTNVRKSFNQEDVLKIVHPDIVNLVEDIVKYAETILNRKLTRNVLLGMSLHIQTLIDRIGRGKTISNPQLNQISKLHKAEFMVALECVSKIEEAFDLDIPLDEAGFLCMFFVLDEAQPEEMKNYVGILVMMHGNSSATSMVEVTNRLLGTDHAVSLDMPLEKTPHELLEKAKEIARTIGNEEGLLFLVDMGSLLTFGEIVQKELGIPVKVIPLVSTTHVLEATRKAISGSTLDEIYQSVLAVSSHEIQEQSVKRERNKLPKQVIVTACLTGEGSALVIKNLLKNYLRFHNESLQIIPITCVDQTKAKQELEDLKEKRQILCVVSNFRLDIEAPQYNIEQVLSLQAIPEIQQIINQEEIYIKMGETLESHLKYLSGEQVLADVRATIKCMEKELQQDLYQDELMGITLHMCCMIDRLKGREEVAVFKEKEAYKQNYKEMLTVIQRLMQPIELTYGIMVEENEICYLVKFFLMSEENQPQS